MMRHCQTWSPNSSPLGHNVSSIVIIHIHYHIYRTLIKYALGALSTVFGIRMMTQALKTLFTSGDTEAQKD